MVQTCVVVYQQTKLHISRIDGISRLILLPRIAANQEPQRLQLPSRQDELYCYAQNCFQPNPLQIQMEKEPAFQKRSTSSIMREQILFLLFLLLGGLITLRVVAPMTLTIKFCRRGYSVHQLQRDQCLGYA